MRARDEQLGFFGCFNNFTKINEKTIYLWSEILKSVSNSKLSLKYWHNSTPETQSRILELFRINQISEEQLNILPSEKTTYGHLDCYNKIDIALDAFPYNGATTTLEALWMGVPVITLAGDRAVSSYGCSFLSEINLKELVSFNPENYISAAVNLATDIDKLESLKKNLRNILKESRLLDGKNFALEMENAYQKMWEAYCNTVK